MSKYKLIVSRATALRYLVWEVGVRRAIRFAGINPQKNFDLTDYLWRKKNTKSVLTEKAQRVLRAADYISGRLNIGLRYNGVQVIKEEDITVEYAPLTFLNSDAHSDYVARGKLNDITRC